MSDVIGRGVIEVSADSSKLNAAISEARRKLAGLGDASKTSAARNSASIDKYVKSLEAQNAVFGKSKREAELYRLALKGASDQQLRAANSALSLAEAHQRHEKTMARIRVGFAAIATAAAAMAVAGVVAFDRLAKAAGDFQDMAEKTGDTAENIASLAVAAEVGGVSMDTMTEAIVKLNKGLLGVDDETKDAGAALKALGLNIEDIKAMSGADQLEAIGKALNGFAESSDKSNVALALFSKSGKELLPVLKVLGEEGGRQKILTQNQIEQADDYADKQAKIRAELKLHAMQISTQMLPAMNDLLKTIADLIKNQDFMTVATAGLKGALSGSVAVFQSLAVVGSDVAFTFRSIGREMTTIKKQATALQNFDFKGISQIGAAADAEAKADRKRLDAFQAAVMRVDPFKLGSAADAAPPAVSDAEKQRLAELLKSYKTAEEAFDRLRKKRDPGANLAQIDVINAKGLYDTEARRIAALTQPAAPAPGSTGTPKPSLNYNPKKPGSTSKQGQERKAQLDADLDLIRRSSDALLNTYSNAERILQARRSANLITEGEYYEAKAAFIRLDADAQAGALSQEIARLGQEKANGKDRIDNEKKIVEARSKLAKVRENEATQIELSNIDQSASVGKVTQAYVEAAAAAQTYIDTIKRQNAREVAGVGRGQQFRERQDGVNVIEDKLLDRKNELDTDLRRKEITPEQYAVYLQIATDTYKKEVQAFDERTAAIRARQADGFNGMTEALQNYADSARDVAGMTEQAFGGALSGLEDALVEFATTGKASFKDLLTSIQADIVRIGFRTMIGNAVDSFLPQLGGMFGKGGINAAGAAASAVGDAAGAAGDAAAMAASTAAMTAQAASMTAATTAATAATASITGLSAAEGAASAAISAASTTSAAALTALATAAGGASAAMAAGGAESAIGGVIGAAGGVGAGIEAAGGVAAAAGDGAQAAALAASTAAIAGYTASLGGSTAANAAATAATTALSAAESAGAAAIAAASASSAAALAALSVAAGTAAAALASVAAGGAADSAGKIAGTLIAAGGRAIGGPVSAGGLYQVNERGPELLSVAGKEYLMMGQHGGSVTPTSAGNSSHQPINVSINQSFAPGTDRTTINQAAARSGMEARRALTRIS